MSNSSIYVDPQDCRNCGKCCKYMSITYSKKLKFTNPLTFSEIDRYRVLQTDKVTVEEIGDSVVIKLHIPCKYLMHNELYGYYCAIYNDPERPLLCRYYPFKGDVDCPHKKRLTRSQTLMSILTRISNIFLRKE
jgi:Fe-S-cluster containining protein